MVDGSIAATLLLGFLLGLRHSLDADHVAAVATVLDAPDGDGPDGARPAPRHPLRRPLLTGLLWGAGHAAILLLVGAAVLALRARIPEALARLFELAVAGMLVGLGVRALCAAVRGRVHIHEHDHDGERHAHLHFHARPHPAPHRHPHPLRFALRPLLIGGLHGLAGSAGLALLALATLPTLFLGCLYLGVFGAGSMLGMAALSLALGAPLVLARRRSLALHRALRGLAGAASLAVGLLLAWDIAGTYSRL